MRDFENIVVPEPIEDFTTTRVITMEYLAGIDLHDIRAEVNEMLEVRHSCAGVVDGEPNVGTKAAQGCVERRVVIDDLVFGDLQNDGTRAIGEDSREPDSLGKESRRHVQA